MGYDTLQIKLLKSLTLLLEAQFKIGQRNRFHPDNTKKFRIKDTPNLLTNGASSTNIFVAGVNKGADSIYLFIFFPPLTSLLLPASPPL